jgi:adenosylmethionine-8-amino-7-oxononanoate aminotransferase
MTTTAQPRTDTYPLWHPMTGMRRYLASPVTIVRGRGSRVIDDEGTEYVSANAGLWNIHCGYDEARIQDAIREQLAKLSYGSLFRFGNEPALRLAARLIDLTPPTQQLTKVFYGTSGASGVDAALKLVRRYQRLSGRPERMMVGALADSYHGTLYGAMSVTGEDLEQDEYAVDRTCTLHVPTPVDGDSAARALSELARAVDRLAAVIIEPILGSAGVVVPHRDFFAGLSALCKDNDVLLIADEVATGFGRTGRMFGYEHFGLEPDLVVMSKGINGGYLPISAVLIHQRVWDAFQDGGADLWHGETQAGNPLACAAALATLDVIEDDGLVDRARQVGDRLATSLADLAPLARGQAAPPSGRGLMLGMHLEGSRGRPAMDEVNAIVERFRSLGVIVQASPLGFSLLPPLTINDADVEVVLRATATVFDQLDLS